MNDQVTASTRPRAASTRRTRRTRDCISVSTGRATPASRGIGVAGTWSTPTSRTTSSTRSTGTEMSGRQDGGAALSFGGAPFSSIPSAVSSFLISPPLRSRPLSRLTSFGSKAKGALGFGGLPAISALLASPPQMSSTMRVASSRPGTTKSGSTPRSNLNRASD